MALISLDNVSKIYPKGTRPALDDINLDIERGDFVFLVGASGSGKTTLLSLLLREEEATNGEIRVAGNDLRRITNRQVPQYRRSLGFVFQCIGMGVNNFIRTAGAPNRALVTMLIGQLIGAFFQQSFNTEIRTSENSSRTIHFFFQPIMVDDLNQRIEHMVGMRRQVFVRSGIRLCRMGSTIVQVILNTGCHSE